jgi:hypothetical protein
MALGSRKKSTFVTISKGKLNVWDGESNTEHEVVSGRLVDIDFNTRPQTSNQKYPNHEDIRLHMQDGDENYIVTCTAKTGAGRMIMKQLPNIDPDQEIEISLSYEAEFKATSVFIRQASGPTKWFWKNGDLKDLPAGVKYIDQADGSEKTQYNAQTAYLKDYVLAYVKPKLSPPKQEQYVPDFEGEYSQDNGDDAPF